MSADVSDAEPTRHRRWQGSCGFRLMPDDELHYSPASAETVSVATGFGTLLRYRWRHPTDGEQSGVLVWADRQGEVTSAAWLDSWHQKPELRTLSGRVGGDGVFLETDYDGWAWRVEIVLGAAQLKLLMYNVIPPGTAGMRAGPYVVMDGSFEPVDGEVFVG